MTADAAVADRLAARAIHPSAWLIVATLALLLGQAVAAASWPIPWQAGFALLAILFLVPLRRWRRRAILLALAAILF